MEHLSDKHIMFRNRLAKVYRHLSKVARREGVSCYRIYDRDLPEFPLIIEKYGSRVYLTEYQSRHPLTDEEHEAWWQGCVTVTAEVLEAGDNAIFQKLRKRKSGRQDQYTRLGHLEEFFEVAEGGLRFWVNLSDYIDTGLFLDHRLTRQRVREAAKGKSVLNLFCYTGSFSVYAASGGASRVVSVDLSNTYLDWARRNFLLNGFADNPDFEFVRADVMQYLKQVPPSSFDLIVADPPTFSNSKMMQGFWDIQRDHPQLLNQCLNILAPGGQLYFSTNSRKFQLDRASLITKSVTDITEATTPFDFKGKLNRYCFLLQK